MPFAPPLAALALLAALVLAGPAGPAMAEGPGIHAAPGEGSTRPGGASRLQRERESLRDRGSRLRERTRKLPEKRRRIRERLAPVILDGEADREVIVIERPPDDPPEAAPEPEPDTPPDPSGPFAGQRARGADRAGEGIAVGATLPRGMVYVTLNWRTYDLPRPPDGEIYARVGREVVRLDPASRRVTARIRPEGPGD